MAAGVYAQLPIDTTKWLPLSIPADTVAIQFKNDSRYDFLINFGGPAPPAFTSSLAGQANGHAFAYEYPVLPIQPRGSAAQENALNASRAFDGNVWYLAIDNTASLSYTGTLSGRALLTIIAYGPADPTPTAGTAVARAADTTSQDRVIAVPVTAFKCWSQVFNFAAASPLSPSPDDVVSLNVASTGQTQVIVYLYSLVATNTVDGLGDYKIQLKHRSFVTPSTILRTDDFYLFSVFRSTAAGNWARTDGIYDSAFPFSAIVNPPVGTGIISVQVAVVGVSAFPQTFTLTLTMDSDVVNGQKVPAIGGGENAVNPTIWGAGAAPTKF